MKKGFTLIELLAVILILGIISLIAIPTVSNILKESKKNSFNASVKSIARTIEDKCSKDILNDKETAYLYKFNDGTVTPSVDVKGKLPDSGYIALNNKCEADIVNVTNGDYYVNGTHESVEMTSSKISSPLLDKGYKIYYFKMLNRPAIDENSVTKVDFNDPDINGVVLNKAGITNVFFYGFYSNSVSVSDAKKIQAILNKRVVDENKTFYDQGFSYYIDYENGNTLFLGDICNAVGGSNVCGKLPALQIVDATTEEEFIAHEGIVVVLK